MENIVMLKYIMLCENNKDWHYRDALTFSFNEDAFNENKNGLYYKKNTKEWYLNGKLHREDGPAVEFANGVKQWYQNGKRHREDGPAVEHMDGNKEYCLNDKRYSQEEFEEKSIEYKAKKWKVI
jgi:hypothetical protein